MIRKASAEIIPRIHYLSMGMGVKYNAAIVTNQVNIRYHLRL